MSDAAEPPTIQLRFHTMLATAEKALRLSLDEARAKTTHPGDKGDDVEAETRSVLSKYLPAGFSVGEGKVYDPYGNESKQADVVITNPDHPFRYPTDKTGAYMIEGMAAVGEVKSVLTTLELERAIKAGARYKTLRPTFSSDDKIFGAANRELGLVTGGVPPFFVLAFESSVATKTILETLKSAEKVPLPDGKGYPDCLPPSHYTVCKQGSVRPKRFGAIHGPLAHLAVPI